MLLCFIWLGREVAGRSGGALFFLSLLLGVVALILTQTRGTWLAGLMCIAVFVLNYVCSKKFEVRTMLVITVGLIVGLIAFTQLPPVAKRVDLAISDVERYLEGDRQSSIGARLDMYITATQIIMENPIIGNGLDSYKEKALRIRHNTPGMSGDVGNQRNPHNEFLQQWLEKGVLGIISYFAIIFGVFWVFFRLYNSGGVEVRYYASCAMALVAVYFVVGQSGALFEHKVYNYFYCVMIMFFLAQARLSEKKDSLKKFE